MEKIKLVSWLTKLEKGERQVAMLIFAVIALSAAVIGLFYFLIKTGNEKETLIRKGQSDRIECEQRAAATSKIVYEAVQVAVKQERDRSDSQLANCEREKQDLLLQRIYAVERSRKPLTKILKR